MPEITKINTLQQVQAVTNQPSNVHPTAAIKHGLKNAFAGMDINKLRKENANLFAKKDINSIIKLKHIVRKFVHGTIFMKDNGINVWLVQRTVFGNLAGINADAMEDTKKFMENVF